ncbi:hypothetical protein EUX98_g442 [Antrodiella citrinella]|uniref:GAR domain-containing protein n=1 Tax=Antrodiella citrinella TaxID=2447956 RepID=A0A4V3XJP2_9APHY|nr:hypothetical protein EUX98_g442 [Antrodiella citrinella]
MSGSEDPFANVSGSTNFASDEQSGTLNPERHDHLPDIDNHTPEQAVGDTDEVHKSDGEEQPLEWHEVIELQAFSDRKVWIEEKTKRNLSPADTDLIELTLTTIYALDKLLHLLRDRSDHLDLLDIRLTWEERRTAAWLELKSAKHDITNFLRTRARWSPTVYDELEALCKEEDSTPSITPSNRRNSVVSIASVASDTSISSQNLSRGARFKLSEQLSRDAAQFASRVSSLRHSKINTAGKALDKLIDESRKPVPEVLLDEQDRLEDKGINEMEDVGKFVMSVVMQWKKADELYVETGKDKVTALELVEEIETAKFSHPNPRQDAAYLSRTNALTKRLAMRGNPAATSSTFPRPVHPLFPDQPRTTDSIVQLLSSEYITAIEHARKAEALSRQYHSGLDAVRKVEAICKSASDLQEQLASCVSRLRDGVGDETGDGTPPDLATEACLSPARHAAFLALLPALLQNTEQIEAAADALLESSNFAFADLDRSGIDAQFVAESRAEIDHLRVQRGDTRQVKETVLVRVAALNDLRRWWEDAETVFKTLGQIRYETVEVFQRDSWKQQSSLNNAPPTPDGSPASQPLQFLSGIDLLARMDAVAVRFEQDVSAFADVQAIRFGPQLRSYMVQCRDGMSNYIGNTRTLLRLMASTREQAAAMRMAQSEVNEMQALIEDLEIRLEQSTEDVLEGILEGEQLVSTEQELSAGLESLKVRLQSFTGSLVHRIPFLSDGRHPNTRLPAAQIQPPISLGFSLDAIIRETIAPSPIDPSEVDLAIRMDANACSVTLSVSVESVEYQVERFRLSRVSRALDIAVTALMGSLQHIEATLTSVVDAVNRQPVSLAFLDELSGRAEDISTSHIRPLSDSFDSIPELLVKLATEPRTSQPFFLSTRQRDAENVQQRYSTCKVNLESVVKHIAELRHAEEARIADQCRKEEEHRRAAEQRQQEEEARRAAELAAAAQRLKEEEARQAAEIAAAECLRQEEEVRRTIAAELRLREEEEARRAAAERMREEEEARLAAAERLREEEAQRIAEIAEAERLREEEAAGAERMREDDARRSAEAEETQRRREETLVAEQAAAADRLSKEEEERQTEMRKVEQRLKDEEKATRQATEQQEQEKEARQAQSVLETLKAAIPERSNEVGRIGLTDGPEPLSVIVEDHDSYSLEESLVQPLVVNATTTHLLQEVDAVATDDSTWTIQEETENEDEPDFHRSFTTAMQSTKPLAKALFPSHEINQIIQDATRIEFVRDVHARPAELSKMPSGLQPAWEPSPPKDIFSVRADAGPSSEVSTDKSSIFELRKRLRSIGINELARPSVHSTHALPTGSQRSHVEKELATIVQEIDNLPAHILQDEFDNTELRSLHSEIKASSEMLNRVRLLAAFAISVEECDNALSDLLEHIDSYPSLPSGPLTASHGSDPLLSPEDQLTGRLTFTEGLIDTLKTKFISIADDYRARSEHERIIQTWGELQAMAMDMTQIIKSRPVSVISSARSNSTRPASVASHVQKTHKKAAGYANLSVGSPSQFLSPPMAHARRAVSGGTPRLPRGGAHARTSSRASTVSNRSVSGPGPVDTPSRLQNSTFASRQRTSSISSVTSAGTPTKVDRPVPIPPTTSRARAQTAQSQVSRTSSPAFSDVSSMYSRSSLNQSRLSMRSSWARAPRQSFPNLTRSPPRTRPAIIRKPYVANPQNKLDVAVGDVVNKLPSNVDINVEVVADTWKDQSGKYWIGSQDPKLCFCRILRSQTVMVRVGGGWAELSKFIKNHFADAFRLLPESPPRMGTPSRTTSYTGTQESLYAFFRTVNAKRRKPSFNQVIFTGIPVDRPPVHSPRRSRISVTTNGYTDQKLSSRDFRGLTACETSLTEPDDVVVCSLHPTNDYKTSVLSGLNPVIVLEICSSSFQQTVLRTINDKSAYLQKELDNAVREARGQISLLNNKLSDVERDLDLERKRATSLQDAMKDREKEYQKLKVQYDKIKRKALLTPGTLGQNMHEPMQISHAGGPDRIESHSFNNFPHHRGDGSTPVDVGAVVGY